MRAGSGIDTLAADYNTSAACGDYELDSEVDLLVAHWGSELAVFSNNGDSQHLWRNDSDANGDSIYERERCG